MKQISESEAREDQERVERVKANQLLPCPFCGSAASIESGGHETFYVARCGGRGCYVNSNTGSYHREAAIQQWNTRTRPAQKDDYGLPMNAGETYTIADALHFAAYESIKDSELFEQVTNPEWDSMADELAKELAEFADRWVVERIKQ